MKFSTRFLKPSLGVIVFIICFFALSLALLAQYVLMISPCPLCFHERWGLAFLMITACCERVFQKKFTTLYILFSFLLGLVFLYHFGIEQAWWHGYAALCHIEPSASFSTPEELKEHILSQGSTVSCASVTWRIMGVPATLWGAFSMLILCGWSIKEKFKNGGYNRD